MLLTSLDLEIETWMLQTSSKDFAAGEEQHEAARPDGNAAYEEKLLCGRNLPRGIDGLQGDNVNFHNDDPGIGAWAVIWFQ